MNKLLKNFLIGFGSIIAIAPQTDYSSNRNSDGDNLASDWYRIGDDMRKAMNIITDEKKEKHS